METEASPIFVAPEVIQAHLEAGTPLPKATAEIVWLLNYMFGDNDETKRDS